jgi:ATP-dependent DNA helicase PIF1
LSQEGWGFLYTRVANQLSSVELASMDNALQLYFTKAEVHERNLTKLAALNRLIKKISARHTGRKAAKVSEEEADNLSAEIYMYIRAKVILTTNLWNEVGLANGSMGMIHNMSWDVRQDITSMPLVILVKFDGYTGPAFPNCGEGIIPIFYVTRQFEYKSVSCSRTQFPLRLVYAIIVHKSQGMSLDAAIMNLRKKQHCLRLAYVAVSRIRTTGGVVFEEPFDFEHFKHKESAISQDRAADAISRNTQLL